MTKKELRWYQREIIAATLAWWDNVSTRALVSAWVGAGKTFTFVKLVRQLVSMKPKVRVLVLAHRQELINQPRKAFVEEFTKEVIERSISIGMVGGFGGQIYREYKAQIICASVQSLVRNGVASPHLLAILAHGPIDVIIFDEVHHIEAETFKVPIDVIEEHAKENGHKCLMLGVTATPERQDGLSLGITFPEVMERDEFTFYYPYKQAVADKVACQFDAYVLETNIDLGGFRTNNHGEVSGKRMTELWEAGNWADLMIKGWLDKGGKDISTVAFMPSVAISAGFVKHLGEKYGIEAGHISADGEDKAKGCWRWSNSKSGMVREERSKILSMYNKGEIRFLSNVNVLTEGWDSPQTKCLVLARPTKSLGTYIQMVGRATRPYPGPVANGEKALLLHVGFEGHQFVDTNRIGDIVPEKVAKEVEKIEEQLSLSVVTKKAGPICNKCGGALTTKDDQPWCPECLVYWTPPEEQKDFLELIDTSRPSGKSVHFRAVKLMADAKVQWTKEAGIMSVYLGVAKNYGLPPAFKSFRLEDDMRQFLSVKAERSLIVLPPGGSPKIGDKGFSLLGVYRPVKEATFHKGSKFAKGYYKYSFEWYKYVILKIGELDAVLDRANLIIEHLSESMLAEKDKDWRKEPATAKQVEALSSLGYRAPSNLTKGEAARIQSFKYAQQFLAKCGVL